MIFTTMDFDQKGKQHGYLQMPYSHNLAGWANLLIPMTVINGGTGPTALVLAGTHGDEYVGQIAVSRLAHELKADAVQGRLILIPTLNQPASRASTRLSPIDGKNLNRAFPGLAEGTPTEQIAYYLTSVLFPLSDIVVDIHTGGRGVKFYPCTCMDLVSDKQQLKTMLEATLAWNTDFLMLYLTNIAGTGLLPVEAEKQGKIVVTTELGGGEWYPADVHQLTQKGLRNVLVHLGVLAGQEETRESLGKPPTRLVRSLNKEDYLMAPEAGFFEPLVDLGTHVNRGQRVGQLHFLDRPDRPSEAIDAKSDGYLICYRAPCLTQQGDCVAVTAQEIDVKSLI